VALKDVDADLQRSLGLRQASGALVQDVTSGSPGERAGVRT
jgi:S1-C subfamily serine protease